MSDCKKVSVVMATYNGSQYIREQLDSIIAQTYPIHELIIQDDCSSDATVSICREYEQKYPFVHVFVNEKNKGYNENFKTAAMRSTGDFVAISDQDDIWFADKIEKQVAAIGEHTMCYSQHLRGERQETSHLVNYKNAAERQMFNGVVGHSMLLDAKLVHDDKSWPGKICYDVWLSVLAHFRNGVVKINEPLNWHRTHVGEVSYTVSTKTPIWKPYVEGFKRYRELQTSEGWILFYQRILSESKEKNSLVNTICRLLLNHSLFALLRLCFLCHKHRQFIRPTRLLE